MTRETKAGLVVSFSFLCLVGVVVFCKLNEKESSSRDGQNGRELAELTAEPRPVSGESAGPSHAEAASASGVRPSENRQTADAGGVLPPRLLLNEDRGSANPSSDLAASRKESPPQEPGTTSPSPAVTASNEPPAPASKTAAGQSYPMVHSTPAPVIPGSTPASDASRVRAGESGQTREKSGHGSTPSPTSEPQAPVTAVPAHNATGNALAQGAEIRPSPDISKVSNTAAPGSSSSPPVSATAVTADSAGAGAKSTVPLPALASPAALHTSAGEGSGAETPAGVIPATAIAPAFETSAQAPKPAETARAPISTANDRTITEGTPRHGVSPPGSVPSDSPKPLMQLPDPPPPAPGVVPSPKTAMPWSDKPAQEGPSSVAGAPLNQRPAADVDHKMTGPGADHKTPGGFDANSATGLTGAPFPPPATASPVTSPSTDPPRGGNADNTPSASPGVNGLTKDFGARPGDNKALPSREPLPADRDQFSRPDAVPPRPSIAPVSGGSGADKDVQLGAPLTTIPLRPSQTPQAPAVSMPVGRSGENSPTRSLPPLGALPPAASPPISAPPPFGSSQSPAGSAPQVESYDEETYICKANDTFRTISQERFNTDQYERALLLFNRNHPLATSALQQGVTILQAGQPVYIPPARILQKYYGAPASDSPPPVRSPMPVAGADRPEATGFVRPAAAFVPDPGTPLKPVPPPNSVPLYRVREGGELLREIAYRTLGSGERWAEIYCRNPGIDPKEPVPGGTSLRLPRDAHVDPRDIP